MILALLALFSAVETRRAGGDLASLRAQVTQQELARARLENDRETYQRALAILSAPDMREVILQASGKPQLREVHAYWSARLGLVLAGQRVPQPAAGRAWQLWIVPKEGAPSISAGVFHPDADGTVLMVCAPRTETHAATSLVITDEPSGGSLQPTAKPAWSGVLPARY